MSNRPLAILAAIILLIVFGVLALAVSIGVTIEYLNGEVRPDLVARTLIRLPIVFLLSVGWLISAAAIWLRKSWGRWLAVSVLIVFMVQNLGLRWAFSQLDETTLFLVFLVIFSVVPAIAVGALLTVGSNVTNYFSSDATAVLPAPPLPPVFED